MAKNAHTQATDGAIALHRAIRADDVTAGNLFLKYGADTDAQDEDGATALHWAAWEEDIACQDSSGKRGRCGHARQEWGDTRMGRPRSTVR